MEILDNFFWIIIIIVIAVNLLIFKHRAKEYIDANQNIKHKANRLYLNVFIFLSLPFLVQGIAQLTGNIKSPFDLMRYNDPDVFLILWYLTNILIWIKGTYWIFAQKGAEFMSGHPEIILKPIFRNRNNFPIKLIKIGWGFLIFVAIWGMISPLILFNGM